MIKVKLKKYAFFAFILFYTVFLLMFGGEAKNAAADGLTICCDVILITVFPFAVASDLIASSGLCGFFGKTLGLPFKYALGLSDNGCGIFLLGLVGGYPTGAACSADMYKRGLICKAEAEVLISYTNNATPAFLIIFAGSRLGGVKAGVLCYFSVILSAFLWGLILRKKTGEKLKIRVSDGDFSFAVSVKKSTYGCINICAFIIIFSVISRVFELFFGGGITAAALTSVFEITTGISRLFVCGADMRLTASLVAAFSAFSGVCVLSQIISISKEAGLNIKYLIGGKIFQAVISFFAVYLLYPLFLY